MGPRHGSTAGGDRILVALNRYPDGLRKAIAPMESGIPSSPLSEAHDTHVALSERRSGMYRRLK